MGELPGHLSEYEQLMAGDPALERWRYANTRMLPEMVRSQSPELPVVDHLLEQYIRTVYGIRDEIPLPSVTWVVDEPGITNITGKRFAVPTLEFGPKDIPLYKAINRGKMTQGVAIPVPTELITINRIRDAKPSRAIMLPSQELDRGLRIDFEQRRRHEMVHAVDPNLKNRGVEDEIIAELVALLGEISDPERDGDRVRVVDGFLAGYIAKALDAKGTLYNYSEDEVLTASRQLEHFIYQITTAQPKSGNAALCRKMMNCKSVADVAKSWQQFDVGSVASMFRPPEQRIKFKITKVK